MAVIQNNQQNKIIFLKICTLVKFRQHHFFSIFQITSIILFELWRTKNKRYGTLFVKQVVASKNIFHIEELLPKDLQKIFL